MRYHPALAICLLLFAPSLQSQQPSELPEFHVGDLRFGFQLTPDQSCVKDRRVPSSFACYAASNGRTQFGGVPVSTMTGTFLDGKLYRLQLDFDQHDYDELRELLTASYGKPELVVTQPVQNNAGAQFTNEAWNWKVRDGEVTLWKYGSRLDRAMLLATHTAMTAEYETRRAAALRESVEQLKKMPLP